jgi:hypothetical protein
MITNMRKVLLVSMFFISGTLYAFDDRAAKAIFESRCSVCHSLDWPLEKRKSRDGWKETVKRMKARTVGDTITSEDENVIVDYLSRLRSK